MDEFDMQELLQESLELGDELEGEQKVKSIETFQRAMLLTSNKGLVVTMQDGSEFQVTIVQTKLTNDEEDK